MIRMWGLADGKCQRSYYIETREDQIAETNDIGSRNQKKKKNAVNKATLAKSDDHQKYIILAFEGGQVQVNDLFTGSLIYNNQNFPSL